MPGATRSLDKLEPGADGELDLPLPAQPKTIAIAQIGPWAQRRVDVPMPPRGSARYSLPEVVLDERAVRRRPARPLGAGAERRLDLARRPEEGAAHFESKTEGELDVPVASGEHDLVAKVETSDGVAIFDLRHLTRE